MKITDEAVEAGLKNYAEGGCMGLAEYERREVVVDILEAALPHLLRGSVRVKPLEWTEYETEGWADRADAEASPFGVFYNITIEKDGYRVVFDHEAVGALGVFETAVEAKSAAQADYERRILSAILPDPVGVEGGEQPSA